MLLFWSSDAFGCPSSIFGRRSARSTQSSSMSFYGTAISFWERSFVCSNWFISLSIALLNCKPSNGRLALDAVRAYLNFPFDSFILSSLLSWCFFLFASKSSFAALIFSFFSASHCYLHLARAYSFSCSCFSYLSFVFSVFSFLRVKSNSAFMVASFSYFSWVQSSMISSIWS